MEEGESHKCLLLTYLSSKHHKNNRSHPNEQRQHYFSLSQWDHKNYSLQFEADEQKAEKPEKVCEMPMNFHENIAMEEEKRMRGI